MSAANGNGTRVASSDSSELHTRHGLPGERKSLTHKFEIGGHKGYITVGFYEDGVDGDVGEIFLNGFGKDGSFVQSMVGCWAKAMSNSLQHGQPLYKLVTNYLDMKFDPSGATTNPEIPYAKSIPDYIARWLALRFLTEDDRELHGIRVVAQL